MDRSRLTSDTRWEMPRHEGCVRAASPSSATYAANTEFSMAAHTGYSYYALAASSDPKGRKYCVPLIGAETLRRSSCKS
jgi:hypothetical protein